MLWTYDVQELYSKSIKWDWRRVKECDDDHENTSVRWLKFEEEEMLV